MESNGRIVTLDTNQGTESAREPDGGATSTGTGVVCVPGCRDVSGVSCVDSCPAQADAEEEEGKTSGRGRIALRGRV